MVINMDLVERCNIIEHSTSIELTKMWEYCMKNARRSNGTVAYKFFGIYESTSESSSDSDSCFPLLFYENQNR